MNEIFQHIQLANLIAANPIAAIVISIAASAAVSFAISAIFHYRGKTRKCLWWSRDEARLFRPLNDDSEFSIAIDGKDVKNPSFIQLYVWNAGTVPIRKDDLPKTGAATFTFDCVDILRSKIIVTSHDNVIPKISINEKSVSIFFDYLNPDDGFAFQLVLEREKFAKETKIKTEGSIIGQTQFMRKVKAISDAQRILRVRIVSTVGYIYSISILAAAIATSFGIGPFTRSSEGPFPISILLLVIAAMMAIMVFSIREKAVPIRLRMERENDRNGASFLKEMVEIFSLILRR